MPTEKTKLFPGVDQEGLARPKAVCFVVSRHLSIENWIIPAVFAGHINKVVWVKPPWATQMSDSTSSFYVGREATDDSLRYGFSEDKFSAVVDFTVLF